MPNLETAKEELKRLERLECSENFKKNNEIESIENKIQDKEIETKYLKSEMKLLQKKVNKMPEKQRQNAATFLRWLKSNGTEKMTEETKQIVQKICTLSELNQKVEKMRKSSELLTNNERKGLQKLQKKLKDLLEKVSKFRDYYANNLLELAKENCMNLMNKTQEKADEDEKTVEELRKQIEEESHGVEGELDALFIECQFELKEKELKSKKEEVENLKENASKMNKERLLRIAKIDKKLAEILIEKEQKQKEIDTLEKELEENKESAREMSKSFGQMLEEMKKYYGQKMDE
ncbi:hypothetical protein GPALN_002107 [Globodera pallida]|nr:hypothetical protein GPALN_002107 [Globodera pallida]